jgi:predicted nucleic acid-binding protein
MKGLDTPVLLDILRGRAVAKSLLKNLSGEELATTEWNMVELEVLARSGPARGRARRLEALERLRRAITVLPVDERAVRAAFSHGESLFQQGATSVALMLGALEASGCSEWITHSLGRLPATRFRVKVRELDGNRLRNA